MPLKSFGLVLLVSLDVRPRAPTTLTEPCPPTSIPPSRTVFSTEAMWWGGVCFNALLAHVEQLIWLDWGSCKQNCQGWIQLSQLCPEFQKWVVISINMPLQIHVLKHLTLPKRGSITAGDLVPKQLGAKYTKRERPRKSQNILQRLENGFFYG